MPDELETILRLVADGHLAPEQAAPIIEALDERGRRERRDPVASTQERFERAEEQAESARRRGATAGNAGSAGSAGETARRKLGGGALRIRVTERGRQVVNLHIPVAFAEMAGRMVPGLSSEHFERVRDAIAAGAIGPIVDIEDESGDGVLISLE